MKNTNINFKIEDLLMKLYCKSNGEEAVNAPIKITKCENEILQETYMIFEDLENNVWTFKKQNCDFLGTCLKNGEKVTYEEFYEAVSTAAGIIFLYEVSEKQLDKMEIEELIPYMPMDPDQLVEMMDLIKNKEIEVYNLCASGGMIPLIEKLGIVKALEKINDEKVQLGFFSDYIPEIYHEKIEDEISWQLSHDPDCDPWIPEIDPTNWNFWFSKLLTDIALSTMKDGSNFYFPNTDFCKIKKLYLETHNVLLVGNDVFVEIH